MFAFCLPLRQKYTLISGMMRRVIVLVPFSTALVRPYRSLNIIFFISHLLSPGRADTSCMLQCAHLHTYSRGCPFGKEDVVLQGMINQGKSYATSFLLVWAGIMDTTINDAGWLPGDGTVEHTIMLLLVVLRPLTAAALTGAGGAVLFVAWKVIQCYQCFHGSAVNSSGFSKMFPFTQF